MHCSHLYSYSQASCYSMATVTLANPQQRNRKATITRIAITLEGTRGWVNINSHTFIRCLRFVFIYVKRISFVYSTFVHTDVFFSNSLFAHFSNHIKSNVKSNMKLSTCENAVTRSSTCFLRRRERGEVSVRMFDAALHHISHLSHIVCICWHLALHFN